MPWQIVCSDSQILSIHAALLPIGNRGQVVLFGGDEHNDLQAGRDNTPADPNKVDNTRIHDLDNSPGTVITIKSPTTDVFCSSHAFLGDGRLVIGGGTESWEGGGGPGGGHGHGGGQFGGHTACWVFNYKRKTWDPISNSIFKEGAATGEGEGGGRWYPTLLTLPSGELIAFSGHPSRRSRQWHNNNIPEIYSPVTNSWRRIARHNNITFYPRVHLIRGNRLFIASGIEGAGNSRFLDLNTEALTDQIINRPLSLGNFYNNWDNTSVLLPLLPTDGYVGRVLMCNDINPIRIDLDGASPTWQVAGSRPTDLNLNTKRRQYACSTILPNGTILINGGFENPNNDPATAVNAVEIYDPGINWASGNYIGGNLGSWSTRTNPNEIAQVPRNYHSTALLLPDGSVWTAGSSKGANAGDPSVVGERRIEIYEPDYYNNLARPDLTDAPVSIDYQGNSFTIRTPQRNSIQRVALIRCGSSTHAGNFDQRYVGCSFTPTARVGDGLTVTYPTDSSVLPPGYYMLWIIDNAGLPCKNAKFVRVAHRSIHFLLDHSTFSQHEVASLRHTATDAVFPKALYVVLDGYLRSEIGSTPPSVQLNFDTSEGIAVPNSDARLVLNGGPQFEHALEDVPQRITYAFDVVFSNENPFSAINPMTRVRSLIAVGAFDNHVTEGTLQLSLNPNPYMTDGPVEWLSTDIRVFTIKQGESFSGLAGLVHNGNAVPFIQTLLNRFNGGEGGVFDTIQENNSLDLSPLAFSFFPLRIANIFNYAVAKVRYRSLTEAALGVQVFFRLFQAATADVSFHGNTGYYRRSGNGANAIPLLGKSATNQLLTMPFFADERVADMRMQPNGNNKKPLAFDASGGEVDVYFGCWLDINQGTPRFPRVVNSDGPFNPSEMVSIQQLVRGLHQCLVAEIHYDLDPIPIGATPGTSDNLAQRNLTIDHSDNPGSPDTHIVRHTFELKPTKGDKGTTFGAPDADGYVSQGEFGRYYQRYAHPDELMINWGNLPRTSAVSIYLPEILADDILAMQPFTRLSTSRLEKVDEHTIRCEGAADITYIPIPMTGRTENITGIFTVELPSTVIKGQTFHTVVQQIEGTSRRIIGAFQMTIPVSTADVLLPMLSHKLSILKHIQRAVPPSDRWYSTFNRYVLHFSDKVKALGGNPDTILPSATGLATTFTEGVTSRQCLILQWLMTALLVLTMVVMALVPTILGSISMVILIVALIATAVFWWKRCKPSTCTAFRAILLALNIAVAIVCLTAALTGISTTAVLTAIGILSIFNIISLLILMWKKCL